MTEIRKYRIYLLILYILLLPLISPLLNSILKVNENFLFNDGQDKINIPKSSGFWVMGPLHIKDSPGPGGDYTWAEAVLQNWCSGDGSLNTPYLLENITIDAGGSDSGITILDSNGEYFTIRNCTVSNSGTIITANAGIKIEYSSNGTITNNFVLNNIKNGIYLENSNYNFITNNYVYNSTTSIRLYSSDHNEVLDNNITEGTTGILIDSTSEFNIASGNDVSTHNTGIQIANAASVNNTIVNNLLIDNSNYGILISTTCINNTIELNEVINSNIGIELGGHGNTIFRNILINSITYNARDWGNYNLWDNGSIGNFWDDYGGADADDDGIGDTPYDIFGPVNAKDYFPIWDDGDDINPTISINSPSGGSLYGTSAPTYSLNIFDLNLNQSWYTLNGTATRYFFTPTNGVNVVPIDETGWDSFSDGSMLMTFYVNDSGGNLVSDSNAIVKDAINPTIKLNSPLGGTTFGSDAPEFNLTIYDLHLHDAWYTIGSSVTPHPFSPINGINNIQIDESSWDALPEGSVTINIFVNDIVGNIHTIQVTINKDLSSEQAIPFGNYYIVFLGIGIVSILLVERKKRKK